MYYRLEIEMRNFLFFRLVPAGRGPVEPDPAQLRHRVHQVGHGRPRHQEKTTFGQLTGGEYDIFTQFKDLDQHSNRVSSEVIFFCVAFYIF